MTCSTEITFLLLTSFDRSNQAHIAGTLQCVRLYPFQKISRGAVCELTMPNWGWGECISQRRPRIIPTKRSWSAFCNSCSFTPVSSPSSNIWGTRCPWWCTLGRCWTSWINLQCILGLGERTPCVLVLFDVFTCMCQLTHVEHGHLH